MESFLLKYQKRLFFVFAFIALAFIFVTLKVKLKTFIPGHHGWVSAQSAAITMNTTSETGFQGYTSKILTLNGNIHYFYFNRAPYYSAFYYKLVTDFFNTLEDKFKVLSFLAIFNFFLLLICSILFLIILSKSWLVALSAALITYSSPILMFNLDMWNLDNTSFTMLLLALILMYLLDRKYINRVIFSVFFVIVFAYGWIYPTLICISIYLLLELRYKEKLNFKTLYQINAFKIFSLYLFYVLFAFSYNIYIENLLNNINLSKTFEFRKNYITQVNDDKKIIESLIYRTGLQGETDEKDPNIKEYARREVRKINKLIFPFSILNINNFFINLLFLMFILYSLWQYSRTLDVKKRTMTYALLLTAPLWLVPLYRFSYNHIYTVVMYTGIPLIFYAYLFKKIKSNNLKIIILVCTSILFIFSWIKDNKLKAAYNLNLQNITEDFQNIRKILPQNSKLSLLPHWKGLVPGNDYAGAFYLYGYTFAPLSKADFVVIRKKTYPGTNLTPNNKKYFLYKKLNPEFYVNNNLKQLQRKYSLSKQEISVVQLIQLGYLNTEIAEILKVSQNNILKTKNTLKKKLGTTLLRTYLLNL